MSVKLPSFLTNYYIEKALQNHYNDKSIQVQGFDYKAAVAAGNNYGSLMLRSNVKYLQNGKKLEKSIIIKTVITDPEMVKMFEDTGVNIFQNELIMYDRILPKFHKLLESVGDTDQLFAPAIFIDYDTNTLIFHDLIKSGFKVANRLTGVDDTHVEVLTRKIAKFHACSIVLLQNGSEDFKEFQESPFKDDNVSDAFLKGMYGAFLSQFRTWKGFEMYITKLENVQKRLLKQTLEMYGPSKFPLKVLAHGDLWVNNMMYKYKDDNTIDDLVLIDFQVGYIGAPVLDLMYFTLTSTNNEIKLGKFPEILVMYHKHLAQCLKQMEYKEKIPTLFELYSQYIEKSFYEVMAVTTISAVMLNEQKENADLSGLMSNTEEAKKFREQMFKSERFITTVKHFLPIWDQMGLLDPLH